MGTVRIFDLLRRRVLVTRDSARAIEPCFSAALTEGHGEVVLDFAGVEGMTPSFLDETLSIIEGCTVDIDGQRVHVKIINVPTHLSSKFKAVGKRHALQISESDGGALVISKPGDDG